MNSNLCISIIIPVLNETENILSLIDSLEENSAGFVYEILVVDGGSSDGIIKLLQGDNRVEVLKSKKGRAKQMNYGAQKAKGDILYFLHADSFPPKNFDLFIVLYFQKNYLAGCFRLKFKSRHWWLQLAGWLSSINHIYCRGGDQSLYVESKLFKYLGGYNEDYIIYEDNEFIKRLYKKPRTRFKVIKKPILTSARRYEKTGIWKLQKVYFQIYFQQFLGAGPEKLYEHYKKIL
ncbi:TIGR04283 family arsenosugar biosynthesis glycosyltransferase [Christiangramia echinicola]|uniref:Glycosyltransferase 2-like domain-containing protein n=1 Tax=Christiangramia echinicola TaxID=279359 RepID=A0A1H1SEI0_9FLAO|nr:TIGR04283 family arsenosugar biosynthesis glycosyltransferase [Christiangramia echinicola]SDS46395.1 hypothetical protein SAMN04488552_3245 [Christiangramia echinicola]